MIKEKMIVELRIVESKHPALRQKAYRVVFPNPLLQPLSDALIALANKHGAQGIAAHQVGLPYPLCIVGSKPCEAYPGAPTMPPLVMINPRIMKVLDGYSIGYEGCLSLPNRRFRVKRANEIVVDYQDLTGLERRIILVGFPARVAQHEIDHLKGILIPEMDGLIPDSEVDDAQYAKLLKAGKVNVERCIEN